MFIKFVFPHRKKFLIMGYLTISRGSMKTLVFFLFFIFSCDVKELVCKNRESRLKEDCGLHILTLGQPCFLKILRILLLFCMFSQIVWHFILCFFKSNLLLYIHKDDQLETVECFNMLNFVLFQFYLKKKFYCMKSKC